MPMRNNSHHVDDIIIIGDTAIPPDSTIEALYSLGATFDFIDFWLKLFYQNYQAHSNIHSEYMRGLF